MVQNLLTKYAKTEKRLNSDIQNDKTGGKIVKITNFQALLDNQYSIHSDTRLRREGKLNAKAQDSLTLDEKDS